MIRIIFESHATTFDNENHLASGHYDIELSPLGIQQAKELGQRYENDIFEAIFVQTCKDRLRRPKLLLEINSQLLKIKGFGSVITEI
ncbi:histidine phosphatase family protein [Candidatus Daviesbacteria bacterium]|nr:histidine phosphatase family protein [Candidatus Daviesbacteria bacterium]